MKQTSSFSGEPGSVSAARRFATEALANTPSDVLDAVELMVSELVTNCIRHADAAFELTIVREHEAIRVEVTDRSGGTPTMRSPGPAEPHGRGLQIVNMLSEAWGVEEKTVGGKTVWFTVAAQPRGSLRSAKSGAAAAWPSPQPGARPHDAGATSDLPGAGQPRPAALKLTAHRPNRLAPAQLRVAIGAVELAAAGAGRGAP